MQTLESDTLRDQRERILWVLFSFLSHECHWLSGEDSGPFSEYCLEMHKIKCMGWRKKPIILEHSYKSIKKLIAVQKYKCFLIKALNKILCWYNYYHDFKIEIDVNNILRCIFEIIVATDLCRSLTTDNHNRISLTKSSLVPSTVVWFGEFPAIPVVRTQRAFTTTGPGSIPGGGAKILQA